jgi:hypothetical protein
MGDKMALAFVVPIVFDICVLVFLAISWLLYGSSPEAYRASGPMTQCVVAAKRVNPGSDGGSAHGLSEEDRQGFLYLWHSISEQFTTDPENTVVHAGWLISDMIREYGGAPGGKREEAFFNIQPEDASRIAQDIAVGVRRRDRAGPDELRRAMNLYTILVGALLSNWRDSCTSRSNPDNSHYCPTLISGWPSSASLRR